MALFMKALAKAFQLSSQRFNIYLVPVLMDVLFLILYGMIMGGIFKKAMFYLVQVGYMSLQIYNETANLSLFDIALGFPETRILSIKIIFLLFLTVALIFFAYAFTQGVAWSRAKYAFRKTNTKKWLHLFLRLNLFWFGIFILYKIILLSVRLSAVLARTKTKPFFEYVFLISFAYFVFLSYALLKEDSKIWGIIISAFKMGVTKFYYILPIWIVFAFALFIFDYLIRVITPQFPRAALVIAVIFLLPALTFGRLYLLAGVEELEKKL